MPPETMVYTEGLECEYIDPIDIELSKDEYIRILENSLIWKLYENREIDP